MGIYKEHEELGKQDALAGKDRYTFQDPRLQELYDRGYDAMGIISMPKPKKTAFDEVMAKRQRAGQALGRTCSWCGRFPCQC